MTYKEFIQECSNRTIHMSVAVENEKIKEALRARNEELKTEREQNRGVLKQRNQFAKQRDELLEALEEAVRIASDENNEVFKGNLLLREEAIWKWKRQAQAAIAKAHAQEMTDCEVKP